MRTQGELAAVFDCMVYMQATVSPTGASFAAYEKARSGACKLHTSEEILAELEDVLSRPKLTARFPVLTPQKVREALAALRLETRVAPSPPQFVSLKRDLRDEPYVNLAIASGARYLVTWDRDLLDLMDEGRPEGRAFRSAYPELQILTPTAFLRELASSAVG